MSQTTVKAVLKYSRLSPRKARMIATLVRGKKATVAEAQLKWRAGKVAPILLKLLQSAMANAVHNFKLEKEGLVIKSLTVDSGPVLKRYTPKAFGRATPIRKPTSHINIVLISTKEPVKKDKVTAEQDKSKQVGEKKADNQTVTNKKVDKKISKKDKPVTTAPAGKKLTANKPISKTTKQKV